MQQPGFAKGTTQQQWNREVELNMKALADAIDAGRGELTEAGKLIQGELETQGLDIDKLRQQVNVLSARSLAKDAQPPEPAALPPTVTALGIGLLLVVAGILVANCVRLWIDMKIAQAFPWLLSMSDGLRPASHEAGQNSMSDKENPPCDPSSTRALRPDPAVRP